MQASFVRFNFAVLLSLFTSLTKYLELSPTWKATSHSATQEFLIILWDPEGSLTCSQEPSTDPYPEPDESSPYETILFLYDLS
jgi:hypothetical protein